MFDILYENVHTKVHFEDLVSASGLAVDAVASALRDNVVKDNLLRAPNSKQHSAADDPGSGAGAAARRAALMPKIKSVDGVGVYVRGGKTSWQSGVLLI